MTSFIKKNEIKNNWVLINAENAIVGRLAAYISKVLRGKNKNQYTPNMDTGDFVIVTNIDKIKFTGKKLNNKKYYRHTGHPGGIKTTNPSILLQTIRPAAEFRHTASENSFFSPLNISIIFTAL